MARILLLLGALNGFLTVLLGAFGAHVIRHQVSGELYSAFQTGVQYQGMHITALLAAGLLALTHPAPSLAWCGGLFSAGILLFSGSLYLLPLTEIHAFGAVTPAGGILLLAGWLVLGRYCWRLSKGTCVC